MDGTSHTRIQLHGDEGVPVWHSIALCAQPTRDAANAQHDQLRTLLLSAVAGSCPVLLGASEANLQPAPVPACRTRAPPWRSPGRAHRRPGRKAQAKAELHLAAQTMTSRKKPEEKEDQ